MWNAHMPFVPFRDRPISIDEGSREVRLPHETGVSLTPDPDRLHLFDPDTGEAVYHSAPEVANTEQSAVVDARTAGGG
jgi:hypothetical protein